MIVILTLLIVFAFIARRSREHALAILVAALPLYLVRFVVGPFPSTLLEGAILILSAFWILDKNKKKIQQNSQAERVLYALLFLFVLSASVSVAFSPLPWQALGVWRAYFFEPVLFFIVFLDTVKSQEHVRRMITASILSGCVVALYAVYQKLTGWNIPEPWADERRVTSIYPYPNAVGLYLAPIVWLALGRARELVFEKKTPQAVGAILAAGLCILALVFSKTEAAVVALVATAAMIGLLWNRKARIATALIALVVLIVVVLSSSLSAVLSEKLFLQDWSGQTRIAIWQETVAMLRDNPVNGAGLAGYQSALAPY
ncbi:MAG: O-antigen ligase family protein, partial [Patescibacteria group bacterium]